MSAPVTRGQNELRVIYEKLLKIQEEIEMKLALRIIEVKTILSKGLATKMLGGLALGTILMTATALPFGTSYADGPSRPLVTEETVIDLGNNIIPDDAWMFDSPYYEDFPVGISVKIQGTLDDAWMFDSPYYEDFSGGIRLEGSSLEVQGTPDDAWMFNSPYYEDFPGGIMPEGSSVDRQDTPDDAWMFDAPFYGDFRAQES